MATQYLKYVKKREKFFLLLGEGMYLFGQAVATPMNSEYSLLFCVQGR